MLRTLILTRSQIVRGSVKKLIKNQIVRGLSSECVRRRGHPHRTPRLTEPRYPTLWKDQICRRYANYPPHLAVPLPALSPTMETGTIVSWAKKEGDKLNEGDLLAEIETDKATMGFETPEEGYLAKILYPAGSKDVQIGKIVCIITSNKEDVAAFKEYKAAAGAAAPQPAAPAPSAVPTPAAPAPAAPNAPAASDTGGRVYASPMAKRLAEVRNIRLQGKGSGIFGSFKSSDVPEKGESVQVAREAAQAGAPPTVKAPPPPAPVPGASYIDIPVTSMRATIAKRLVESKQSIPHYYLSSEINVSKLVAFRVAMNKELEKQKVKLSVNDFIIKAVAATTQRVPEVNSAWMGNVIRQYRNVDVSVAVSTDKGLITPIIRDADRKGVLEISKNMKDLATKARENKLQPQDFVGGTICVSNLGMFDLSFFSAIINPPQSAILAVGGIVNRVIADKDGGFKEAPHIIATLSCDHRVIDGALGAAWLKVLKQNLSDPAAICL